MPAAILTRGVGLAGRSAAALRRAIYPSSCVACGARTDADFGVCAPCWRDSHFIVGTACTGCGAPLPGEAVEGLDICDDCREITRPWGRGRAVLEYRDTGRRMVMQLKHGDRTDLARPMGLWLHRAAGDMIGPGTVLVPIPQHWSRLLRRRYNQAALLARSLGRECGAPVLPDALVRDRRTPPLQGHSREDRFDRLAGAIRPHPKRGAALAGRAVLLIDDVMTSGATFAAATEAARDAGAASVDVLALARVTRAT